MSDVVVNTSSEPVVTAVVVEGSSSKIAVMVVSSVILVKSPSQPMNFLPGISGTEG